MPCHAALSSALFAVSVRTTSNASPDRSSASSAGVAESTGGEPTQQRRRIGYARSVPTRRRIAVTLLDDVDALIEGRRLLDHPFYTKWGAGTLPKEAIREYTRQYFAFESSVPRFLSAIHSR